MNESGHRHRRTWPWLGWAQGETLGGFVGGGTGAPDRHTYLIFPQNLRGPDSVPPADQAWSLSQAQGNATAADCVTKPYEIPVCRHHGARGACLGRQTRNGQLWQHAAAPWQEARTGSFVTPFPTAQVQECLRRMALHRLPATCASRRDTVYGGAAAWAGGCCTPQTRSRHSFARPFPASCAALSGHCGGAQSGAEGRGVCWEVPVPVGGMRRHPSPGGAHTSLGAQNGHYSAVRGS